MEATQSRQQKAAEPEREVGGSSRKLEQLNIYLCGVVVWVKFNSLWWFYGFANFEDSEWDSWFSSLNYAGDPRSSHAADNAGEYIC
jgi:hypothetical protein